MAIREVSNTPEITESASKQPLGGLSEQASSLLKDYPIASDSTVAVKDLPTIQLFDSSHSIQKTDGQVIALNPEQRGRIRELAGQADEGSSNTRLSVLAELNGMANNRGDRNDACRTFNDASQNWNLYISNAGTSREGLSMKRK